MQKLPYFKNELKKNKSKYILNYQIVLKLNFIITKLRSIFLKLYFTLTELCFNFLKQRDRKFFLCFRKLKLCFVNVELKRSFKILDCLMME